MDIVQLFPTAYLLDRLRLTHVSLYIKNWNPVRTFQHLSLGFYSFFKLLLCSLSIQIGLEPTSPITVTLLSDPNFNFWYCRQDSNLRGDYVPYNIESVVTSATSRLQHLWFYR